MAMKAPDEVKSTKRQSPIRILIIEDHAIVRAGLRMLLVDMNVVAGAGELLGGGKSGGA